MKFSKWVDYDLLTCFLTIIGLVLTIVDYEYCNSSAIAISQGKKIQDHDTNVYDDALIRLQLSEASIVRVVTALISFFSVVTLAFRHGMKTDWLNKDLPNEIRQNLFVKGVNPN